MILIYERNIIMLSRKITIKNPSGLHLRPAGVLSQTAMKFKSDIIIEYGEKRIVAKSVLNVMAAGIKSGIILDNAYIWWFNIASILDCSKYNVIK